MSSFAIKARHKQSGVLHKIWCMDDYFGKHQYAYFPITVDGSILTEEQFYLLYEPEEPATKQERQHDN